MRLFTATLVLACFVTSLRADDEADNPFRNSKVGDWIEYKMTGQLMSGKTKMTVTSKDDKELAYEIAGTFTMNGKEMTAPLQKQIIDLTKSYDPIVAANLKASGVKTERLGEGAEKLKVGGREYDAKWIKTKTTATANNITIVSEGKMWFCKDVPLSGLVKMETSTGPVATVLELVATGSKK